jgi:hypothetical protein
VPGMVGFAHVGARQRTIAVSPGMAIHVRVCAISAALGVKRRGDLARPCNPRPTSISAEHVVGLEAQKLLAELHRHVPVAEVVGGADRRSRVSPVRELRAALPAPPRPQPPDRCRSAGGRRV